MDKLKMHSPDITQENIKKIQELFPGCVTEASDEQGNLTFAVDFDQLRQELSDSFVEGPLERYHLNWPGKQEALLTANTSINKTLRPSHEDSLSFEKTRNLCIEGDNLDVSKLLSSSMLGKVKLVYMDPPYNTGNDLVYHDKFSKSTKTFLLDTGQAEQAGEQLIANTETNGRFHSDWLSMMMPRLRQARNMLHDSGLICVSIDANEVASLKLLMAEIFGESNYLGTIANINNPKGRSDDKFIATAHEYLVVFAKDASSARVHGFEPEENITRRYNKLDAEGKKFRDIDLRKTGDADRREDRPDMFYYFYFDEANGLLEVSRNQKQANGMIEICPLKEDDSDGRWRWGFETAKSRLSDVYARYMPTKNRWGIFERDYLEGRAPVKVTSAWTFKDVNSERGSEQFISLGFGKEVFSRPKPIGTMKRILEFAVCPDENATIVDFFAGSGTMAQAALELNAEGKRNTKFVLIQWPERVDENSAAAREGFDDIAMVCRERIRRVGKKLLEGEASPNWDRDVGFRVLRTDTSNMKDIYYTPDQLDQTNLLDSVNNVKDDRTPEDLLFQVLIDWGVDLSLPIASTTICDKKIFFVDENALVACFDTGVTEELVTELAKREPLRVVFRDNGFDSDSVKINVEQIFKQLSPMTDVKAI